MFLSDDGVQQPASLDCERGKVSEGGQKGVLTIGERLSLFTNEEPDTDRLSVKVKRCGRKGLPAITPGQVPLRGTRVLLQVMVAWFHWPAGFAEFLLGATMS